MTSKRPKIGITTDYNDGPTAYHSPFGYAAGVERAGGLPFLIPHRLDYANIPQLLDEFDGIVFSGGNDLDPALYGQTWNPKAIPLDPSRQNFERELMRQVEARRLPTLGICLGSQLMNVYRGGSMVQFLPDIARSNSLEHRTLDRSKPVMHPMTIDSSSALSQHVGKSNWTVNSYHKQAMDKIGRGLRVIATAPDGVIEGIEDPTFPLWLGVQWHPERMIDQKEHLAVFEMLVEKAGSK